MESCFFAPPQDDLNLYVEYHYIIKFVSNVFYVWAME